MVLDQAGIVSVEQCQVILSALDGLKGARGILLLQLLWLYLSQSLRAVYDSKNKQIPV